MITSEIFKRYVDFAYSAYQEHNVTKQEYRQNGRVPYLIHPLGAALLHLADTELPFELREQGAKILILHDVLEDTSLSLPDWVDEEVRVGVEEMTYRGSSSLEEKQKWIRGKSPFIQLLILYDVCWNLYERHVGGPAERRALWRKGVLELAENVEEQYGNVRIVHVARAVAKNTEW